MNKEEEIEDSLRFCKELQLYYKSGLFENPRNIFEWEKYIPLAKKEVDKKYKEEIVYYNKELEDAVNFSNRLKEKAYTGFEEQQVPLSDISVGGAAVLQPTTEDTESKRVKRKKKEQAGEIDIQEEDVEESFLKIVVIRFVEVVFCIALAFGISAGFNKFIGTHTMVEGTSMEAALQDGDYLLVDKLSYQFSEPKRFDIIIFPYGEGTYYIKRIIGMPGEKVRIAEGKIYINGQELEDTHGLEAMLDGGLAEEELQIGEKEYFVLGDNRNHSTDSRSQNVGMIQKDKIVGRAFYRFYPFNNMGKIE